jgi:hypothetical protein
MQPARYLQAPDPSPVNVETSGWSVKWNRQSNYLGPSVGHESDEETRDGEHG